MIRVEIASSAVETKTGTSNRTGKSYSIREQECWVHTVDKATGQTRPHPERAVVPLEDNQPPYPVGSYTICPSSIYVARFGMLSIRLRLKPATSATVAAARSAA